MKSLIFQLIFASSAAWAANATLPASGRADLSDDAEIQRLRDADPKVREEATAALISRGVSVREKILAASRSDDPEIRSRAAHILLKLPWYSPDDHYPSQVRKWLDSYGNLGEDERAGLLHTPQAARALPRALLIRLAKEDPSGLVRWAAASAVLGYSRDYSEGADLRALDANTDEPPILALAGFGWRDRDPARAVALLRRAIDLDAAYPQADGLMLNAIYETLAVTAIEQGDFAAATGALREHAARGEGSAGGDVAILMAMRLHFAYPATPLAEKAFKRSRLDVVRRIYAAAGATLPLTARLIIGRTSTFTKEQHFAAMEFFAAAKASAAAQVEAMCVVEMGEADGESAMAHRQLAMMATKRNNDEIASDHLEQFMNIAEQKQFDLHGMDDEYRTEISYRRLRLARARNDTAAEKQQLAALKLLAPAQSNAGVDAIETLRKLGYSDEADEMFKRTYERARAQLAASPSDPVRKNDLAWLCARSGEHLEEALSLAQEAVAAAPQSSSFADTLAEAHYRLGHCDEAIALETRALQARPDDDFLREQLERFKRR